ncbi:MAG: polysaccharide biosynthesis tyrosine autokinase, partial [Anderseniella sp.]|nr:polysaccharide biosynthesis tyrosine autokinase [Anderseniella sp.]
ISDPIAADSSGSAGDTSAIAFSQAALNQSRIDLPTLIEVLKSPLLLEPLAQPHNTTANALRARISITPGGDRQRVADGVLRVSLRASDPEQGTALLEDLSELYLQTSLEQRQERLSEAIQFLDGQGPSLEEQTAELQQQMADFRARYLVLEPGAEGAAIKQELQTRENTVSSLEAERAGLIKARTDILSGSLTALGFQEAIGGADGTGGGGLEVTGIRQSQLAELARLDEELATARSKFTANSSVVQGLEARRNELAPRLKQDQLEAVDTALAQNASRLAVARRDQNRVATQLASQPALIQQYESLSQRLQLAQQNLASFQQTRERFRLEIAQQTVPWKLIAAPRFNPNPVEPSVPGSLSQGALLALAAGVGAALLRDRFDPAFHRSEEVREALKQPLLGQVPHIRQFRDVREQQRFLLEEISSSAGQLDQRQGVERFLYQEALRNLYTSLRFLSSDKTLRSVVLTSSIPSEGKSLVNVLLAKTVADMGQRVLLVDADLRKPQLHTRLGLNNLTGLSNLLAEDDLVLDDVIQTVPGHPDWHVITAGRTPPDPARLLSSTRLTHLVEQLDQSEKFDLILYDTPPILGLADASLVAQHCDGLVLLVSLDVVPRNVPQEAMVSIQNSGVSMLGIVTNSLKKERTSYDTSTYAQNVYSYYATTPTSLDPSDSSNQDSTSGQQTLTSRLSGAIKWIKR